MKHFAHLAQLAAYFVLCAAMWPLPTGRYFLAIGCVVAISHLAAYGAGDEEEA